MPQRSNLFQRLALLVHKTLDPEWEVTESEMLIDLVTGQTREVDIVAIRTVMEHQLVLSIECRDHKRAADVTWVEALAKKHEHLATSKLVLWSRSGFTQQALLKAKALKIDTVSHAQATVPMWARLAREIVGGQVLHLAPRYKAFIDMVMPDGSLKRYESVDTWKFFDENGVEAGSVAALVHYLTHSQATGAVLMDNAPLGPGSFWAELVPPAPWFADLPEGQRCRTHRIGVGINTVAEKSFLQTVSALKGKSIVTLASASVESGTLEFLIEETEDGSTRFSSRLAQKEV
jgi:hypothetical protein